MEIIVNFWIRTPSTETGAAGREGECTKNCREMEFWVGGQIPECTKRRSNLASHKGKQEFSAFTNTEIHEYGFPKYRNTGEWVWQGGGMVGEYRNKKRLATPSNATTSKYTNASCQKLRNTPLPKIHQKFTENDIKNKNIHRSTLECNPRPIMKIHTSDLWWHLKNVLTLYFDRFQAVS